MRAQTEMFPELITVSHYESVFDISFSMGIVWSTLDEHIRIGVMDEVDGSRGLSELAICWAAEFDREFAAKLALDPDCDTYIGDVDDFFQQEWDKFIARVVLNRMTE